MNEIAKLVLIVTALLLPAAVAAQTFKCTDAAGKITYSNTKCGRLGLKDAGEVKDRLNVDSGYPPAKAPARSSDVRSTPQRPSAPPPAPAAPAADTPAPADPANPERRCFVVKTPKGNVTRCNDKPDE